MMMKTITNYLKLFTLLGFLLGTSVMQAATSDKLLQLEADMLNYIATNERDSFFIVTEKLKEASLEEGNERLFYKAWSKQAVYEATHQNYHQASEIAKALTNYAAAENSVVGRYFSLHTKATVLQQEDRYEEAEKLYLDALAIRHNNFPEESAAEDLRELMKIAYNRNDIERAKKYAYQMLAEPNLAPHHKGRTLYRLSIMAFEENDVEEFNRIYEEMKRLMQTNGIRSLNLYTEVNYHIINGDYKHALRLAEWLSADTCAERKAIIYHRMGDNEKAYNYMAQYKHLSDSIARVSHNSVVSNLYLRMNNDRLRLEREVLTHQNSQLRYRFYIGIGVFVILVLLFLVYQRHRIIRLLKHDNLLLDYGKKDAEKAIKDLNELSFYESKTDIPLVTPVRVNKLCNHLTSLTQNSCHKDVMMTFQTKLPDDFEIKTNADALEKLLTYLLNYSARFTHKGSIALDCEEKGDFVRFSITDTGMDLGNKHKNKIIDLFTEQSNTIRYVGMNFSIWQSITRLLHGRIWHDLEYANGTRFCIEIPKSPTQYTIVENYDNFVNLENFRNNYEL